jgi:hypothetical protein
MDLRKLSLATFLAIHFVFATAASADEETNQLYVQNTNPEFVVDDPGNPGNTYTIEALVSGEQSGTIFVEFVDYFSGENSRQQLPGGSLPNSLQGALELRPADLSYEPNGKSQLFALKFSPKESIENRIYSGGIRVGFAPASEGSGFASSTVGVITNLIVTPFGGANSLSEDEIKPANFTSVEISPLERSSFIDRLLPDIPNVVNYGPVEVKTTIGNDGDFPVFVSMQWDFFSQDELIAKQESPKELLRGGLSSERSVRTVYIDPVTERSLNILPSLGFVSLETQLTSELTGVEIASLTRTDTFLVLQWKEPFAIALLIVALYRFSRKYRKPKGKGTPELLEPIPEVTQKL